MSELILARTSQYNEQSLFQLPAEWASTPFSVFVNGILYPTDSYDLSNQTLAIYGDFSSITLLQTSTQQDELNSLKLAVALMSQRRECLSPNSSQSPLTTTTPTLATPLKDNYRVINIWENHPAYAALTPTTINPDTIPTLLARLAVELSA